MKISVIIPVYNVEKYLQKCLDSIVNQSLKDFEIVCINDGSTDSSLEILKDFASRDSRFVIIDKKNEGQGVARNLGINLAKGEYILFVDPDDWIEADSLEILYNYAKNNNAQIVKFNYKTYNEKTKKIKNINFANIIKKRFKYDLNKNCTYSWKTFKEHCLNGLGVVVWDCLYQTDFIKSNSIKMAETKSAEDHLFAIGARLLADKIYYLDKYLYFYRTREGSAVNSINKDNLCIFDNIEELRTFIKKNSLYSELENEFKNYAKGVINWHYGQTPTEQIEKYKELSKKYFESEKEYKTFFYKLEVDNNKFLEQLFSVKNQRLHGKKYKIITFCKLKIRI